MSYKENHADLFDTLAERRFYEQSEIDTDEVLSRGRASSIQSHGRPTRHKPVTKPISQSDDDVDLSGDDSVDDSDAELEKLAEQTGKADMTGQIEEKTLILAELRRDHEKWTRVRDVAVRTKKEARLIGKLSTKINKIFFEINDAEKFIEQHGASAAKLREIRMLESQIEQLELERVSIDQRIEFSVGRLRALRPYSQADDFHNNPSAISRAAQEEEEDDQDRLAALVAQRRKACQDAGEYNNTTRGRIFNPSSRM